ncbi:hypothetical protein NIE88_16410 [Sporolactobacillus shoreicorticis]|uniref:Lanthionine synthetase LanC family protein n=1 Tax=Sporolactobacillus shoreicorticis TaxID=1923877 RepID=A0ABW5S5G3_9BACL|nr:lanthionine synthetase LanC family protein [Sporolactobacillus shoreicorticis]MCO7127354.1 hypothetical protein [Sporolactobacillus shoreicorticis]
MKFYIKDNNGNLVEDIRGPVYKTPKWETFPFSKNEIEKMNATIPLIPERNPINKYIFKKIIERGNKGNVYLAISKKDGINVIIKEARPFVVIGQEKSNNAISILKKEYKNLVYFSKSGYTPKPIDFFECNQNFFLVEKFFSGRNLTSLVNDKAFTLKKSLIIEIIDMVIYFHSEGYAITDFSTNNLLIKNDKVKLVDLENMVRIANKEKRTVSTPLFYNNEKTDLTITETDDVFAMAIIFMTLFFRGIPIYKKDANVLNRQTLIEKLLNQTRMAVNKGVFSVSEAFLVKSLLELSIDTNYRVSNLLGIRNNYYEEKNINFKLEEDVNIYPQIDLKLIIRDNFNDIFTLAKISKRTRIWRSNSFGEFVSPLGIQHGFAGVARAVLALSNVSILNADKSLGFLNNVVFRSEEVIDRESANGYLFGLSGYLWFLSDLYKKYPSKKVKKMMNEIINKIKLLSNTRLDFALGKTGIGYTFIHLWLISKNNLYLDYVRKMAKNIYKNRNFLFDNIDNPQSLTKFGFAHGLSGVAYFIYLVGVIENDKDYISWCRSVIKKIITKTKHYLNEDSFNNMNLSWCEGIAGIGTSLLRINYFEKNKVVNALLLQIATTLEKNMLKGSTNICHGNGSSIEFLMDAYQLTGQEIFKTQAINIAKCVYNKGYLDNNNIYRFLDQTQITTHFDYGVGSVGTLYSLSRVHFNLERIFYLTKQELNSCRNR